MARFQRVLNSNREKVALTTVAQKPQIMCQSKSPYTLAAAEPRAYTVVNVETF